MNILIVSQYFYPENFRVNDLTLALKERGHDVTVLTGMPNYPIGRMYEGYSWPKKCFETKDGVRIYRVPVFLRRESKSWQLFLNYVSFVVSALFIGSWSVRKESVDLVFVAGYSPFSVAFPALLIAKMKRAPLFYWLQDLWPESLSATGAVTSKQVLGVVGSMVKWVYRRCDRVLVQSQGFVEPAINTGANKEQLYYLPNWAESFFKPALLPLNDSVCVDLPQGAFMVMFAGNIGQAQSVETIIDAAEMLKNESIHWVILGDGRRREWMQEQVNSMGLSKVFLLGHRPVETMPDYFSHADAMLVTLCSDPVVSKTLPGKIQSYLACGRPIVGALDGEGAKVINESGSGFAVTAGDATALADIVLKISESSEVERKVMSQSALAYYQQCFERDMLVSQLELWMQQELDNRAA